MKTYLENVRKKSPLIHNITNYVTVNDCANIVLACGASPIIFIMGMRRYWLQKRNVLKLPV